VGDNEVVRRGHDRWIGRERVRAEGGAEEEPGPATSDREAEEEEKLRATEPGVERSQGRRQRRRSRALGLTHSIYW
jgi:hypothetical protein